MFITKRRYDREINRLREFISKSNKEPIVILKTNYRINGFNMEEWYSLHILKDSIEYEIDASMLPKRKYEYKIINIDDNDYLILTWRDGDRYEAKYLIDYNDKKLIKIKEEIY